MAGLFGQPLWLAAPLCGISTPFNSATNDVEIISCSYLLLNKGHSIMKFKSTGKLRPSNPTKQSNHATALPFELLLKLNRQ
jgi:hypothetical protein